MATELITRTWCDICMSKGDTRTPATRSDLVAVGDVRRTLDLCEEHAASWLAPILEALREMGNPAPVTPGRGGSPSHPVVASGRYSCPLCQKPLTTRAGLLSHLQSGAHMLDAVEASRTAGGTLECPRCGFMALDPGGLTVHRRAHDREDAAA